MDSVNENLMLPDFLADINIEINDNEKPLIELRNNNHANFYKLDIHFLKTVDARYQKDALKIFKEYESINSKYLLSDSSEVAIYNQNRIHKIGKSIAHLKDEIHKDLMSVIDYIDKIEERLDIDTVQKNSPLGILISNKYEAYKIYSANLDLNDINYAMSRQSKRLLYLQELNLLITNYHNENSTYNVSNTSKLINNLFVIISKYIYLLSDTEFNFTKEAIKKILSYKYDFIEKYLYTYQIILMKIWNSKVNGNYYFICDLDLDKNQIYLMNNNNKDNYWDSGYVCDIPLDFFNYFKMSDLDIVNFPLPENLVGQYEINYNNLDAKNVNLRALYTKLNQVDFDSILPILYLNKKSDSWNMF